MSAASNTLKKMRRNTMNKEEAKIENNGYTGIPDDLFISADGSKIFLIEFKKNDKQHLRQEQKIWFERFPHICFRCNSIDDFKKITGLE